MTENDLKRLERSTYRAAADSGLWDMFLAFVLAMLAVGPLLSVYLGDFWTAGVFAPFYMLAFLAMRLVQNRVVTPRLGVVEFASGRKRRLATLAIVMLVVNVVALILGIVAARRTPVVDAQIVPLSLSLVLLAGCSTAAFFLQIPRVFAYGILLAAAPPVGEALFRRGYASHHGFPVVFGVCCVVIFTSGLIRFIRFLPPPQGELEGATEKRNHE